MAAVSNSELNEAKPSQMQIDPSAQDGSMSAEGTGVQSEKAKAKAEAKAKAKAEKAAQKAANAAARGQKQAAPTQPDENDPLKDKYGDAERIQSQHITKRKWTRVEALDKSVENQTVLLRGRVATVRGKGKSCFIVLRQRIATVQVVLFTNDTTISKGMVKYASNLTRESIIDVEGTISLPKEAIVACTQSQVELHVTSIHCISRADVLPFEVSDASRSEEEIKEAEAAGELKARVSQDVRLNGRYIDLRTAANQAIFKVQSGVCQLFREILLSEGFQEIHTPKLIAGASEGGSSVFKFNYMGREGCLAQSPQLYKQMAIMADQERVFEIGPVFRAENSFTHRHLCEFTGLDFEMAINEHYDEVMDVIDKLFVYIFNGLNGKYGKDLATIGQQFPFEPLQYQATNLRLPFQEGIKMLQEAGWDADPLGDLSTELERELGKLVKAKYNTDFYMLYNYPLAVRPFYTMPSPSNSQYSNSFDVFIRGEEIISGAQRVHDPALLTERAQALGIPVEGIQSYIDAFKYGAVPHGGAGVGMERVVMLFCKLDNIRKTSLFPRDPKRLTP
ncbi:TPA: hypothetical protein ACH3X2_010137 [Trebouxia sp. C0005]|nr:MAG: aspartate--tRNA cytoplasmic-like [Trebouxia sp. A1-2]KAA6422456.1 MAG: aspartate--tRNA cytoplasmic-like [Trebouxia sp. A1-2]